MIARLAVLAPNIWVHNTPVDPLEGALWLVRRG
jgi:hypothetical protein